MASLIGSCAGIAQSGQSQSPRLDGVQSEEELGQRDVLDVLNAEQELFQSQSDLVRSKRDRALYHYRLLQAVGALTPQTLAIPRAKD